MGNPSKLCVVCDMDKTSEPDQICIICKAQICAVLRDEIEAMLQYDKHPYKKVEIVNNTVVVTIF